MTVTITASIALGGNITPITSDVANPTAIGLAGGGLMVIADNGSNGAEGEVFDSGLVNSGFTGTINGTHVSAAQLTVSGNIVYVSQDADSIRYRIETTDGTQVLASTDIGDTNSTLAQVTALQNGGFAIVNQDAFSGGDFDIDLRFYDAAGALQTTVTIDTSSVADRNASIATLDNGNVVVAWEREVGGETEIWFRIFNENGGDVRTATLAATTGTINERPRVVATDAGFAIAYESNIPINGRNIMVQTHDAAGNFIQLLAADIEIGDQGDVTIARLSDGWLMVGFTDTASGSGTYVRLVRDDLSIFTERVRIIGASALNADQTDITLAQFSPTQLAAFFDSTDQEIEGQVITPTIRHTSDSAADTMFGGLLQDAFFGGAGDVVSYVNATAYVFLDLTALNSNDGASKGDTYSPGLVSFRGSEFADTLIALGLAGGVTLDGGAGADFIDGTDAADSLIGGIGTDLLFGNGGADTLSGGSGADVMDAGLGADTVIIDSDDLSTYGGGDTDTLDASGIGGDVTFSMGSGLFISDNPANHLGYENVLMGGGLSEVFGTAGDNIIDGGGGDDTLRGEAGDDEIIGSAGFDALFGGANDDDLFGGDDADRLSGGLGLDTLYGGNGDDDFRTLTAAEGFDDVFGGTGIDRVVIDSAVGLSVLLGSTGFYSDGVFSRALNDVEDVTTGSGDDVISADAATTRIDAGGGADVVAVLDLTISVIGGAGQDILNLVNLAGGLTMNLATQTFATGFEDYRFTANADTVEGSINADTIRGDRGDDRLSGGLGEDSLIGGAGNDRLDGGAGFDSVDGGSGNDRIVITGADGPDRVTGGNDTDTLDLSGVTGGGYFVDGVPGQYFDVLGASAFFTGIEVVIGTGVDDQFRTNNLTMTFQGGAGIDDLVLTPFTTNVTLSMVTGTANGNTGLFTGFEKAFLGSGNDTVTAAVGTDQISAGVGDDTVILADLTILALGGTGNDILSFLSLAGNQVVDLATQTFAGGFEIYAFGSGHDSVSGTSGAEEINGFLGDDTLFGGGGSDLLIGSFDDDRLFGGTEADTLFGGDNDDILVGDAGVDSLSGGDGNDTVFVGAEGDNSSGGANVDQVDMFAVTANVTFDMTTGAAGAAGTHVLFENAVLGSGADSVSGTSGANKISGSSGTDTLAGLGGNDDLRGGTNDDLLFGGDNDDLLFGGAGFDRLEGGNGDDAFNDQSVTGGLDSLDGGAGVDRVSFNTTTDTIFVNFATQIYSIGVATNFFRNMEQATTSNGNDLITTAASTTSVNAGAGDDTVTLADLTVTATGGTGRDRLDLSIIAGGLVVNLATDPLATDFEVYTFTAGADSVAGTANTDDITGGEGDDTIRGEGGADSLFGSFGNDSLSGGANGDLIYGGSDADVLDGGAGVDTIFGAAGNDIVIAGDGADITSGGTEIDFLDLLSVTANITFDMTTGAAGALGTHTQYERVELGSGTNSVTGTTGDNLIIGGSGIDRLSGGDGADELNGRGGSNTLTGGSGNDELSSDGSALSMNGGTGDDLIMTSATGALTGAIDGGADTDRLFVLNDAALQGTTLSGIEVLDTRGNRVTARAAQFDAFDTIRYNSNNGMFAVTLTLAATGTATTLDLSDELTSGGGPRGAVLTGSADNEVLTTGEGNDTMAGGSGNDRLRGGQGSDSISGGIGNDTVMAGEGSDNTSGGDGTDVLDLTRAGGGVVLNLTTGAGGATGTHRLFENAVMGAGADTVDGTGGANNLRGNAGNDTLRGNGGDDLADGGRGDDRMDGGDGNDRFKGGAGADSLTGGAGNDLVSGGTGDDRSDGGAGADRVKGGAGADVLAGGIGNDILTGNGGSDSLSGDAGNDQLNGTGGNDRLGGGAGVDRFIFTSGQIGDDTVTDFGTGADRLRLDDRLWGPTLTAAQVVAQFGTDTGADVVLDFGAKGSVTLLGVGGLAGLDAQIDIL